MKPAALGYRPEVDGIRALAVLSVIIFHAGYRSFSGGFLGVDIFFVISGYLITTILHSDLDRGSFSIWRFYQRRIRRIAPALLLTILVSIPFACWLMLPDDLENFGQSAVATILFANNMLLMMTSGYFAEDVEFKPLMHTWSLGVEEQYYVVIPLLIWLAYRCGRRRATATGIAAATVSSFAFCLWASRHAPAANFYLILSRIWELGAGSMVAVAEPWLRRRIGIARHRDGALALAGLVMIAAPIFLVDGGTSPPNGETAIPVLGAALLLIFAREANLAGRLLAWPPLVTIGLISYSAYLIHQPLFVFTRIASLEPPGRMLMTALIPVTLVLAYLSWRFVERPFRDRRTPFRRVAFASAAAAVLGLAIGLSMHVTGGFYQSRPEFAEGDTGFSARDNEDFNLEPYRFRDLPLPPAGGRANILVLGNSFARDFINMGLAANQLGHHNISYSDEDDCAPLTPAMRANAPRADFIVMASDISRRRTPCVQRRIAEFRTISRARPIVLGPKNFGWNNNAVMRLDPGARYAYRARPLAEIVATNDLGRASFPPEIYVDVLAMLMDANGRVPVFTPDRKFISQDRRHTTRAGARYVGALIFTHPLLRALHEGRRAAGGDAPAAR